MKTREEEEQGVFGIVVAAIVEEAEAEEEQAGLKTAAAARIVFCFESHWELAGSESEREQRFVQRDWRSRACCSRASGRRKLFFVKSKVVMASSVAAKG